MAVTPSSDSNSGCVSMQSLAYWRNCDLAVVSMLWHWQSLRLVLKILLQCTSAMRHIHSCGIIHRDFRAANILVSRRHPIVVAVADFGVSCDLAAFVPRVSVRSPLKSEESGTASAGGTGAATTTAATTAVPAKPEVVYPESVYLVGDAALGPTTWMAPECVPNVTGRGRIASIASDVYMLGGLMFEVGC